MARTKRTIGPIEFPDGSLLYPGETKRRPRTYTKEEIVRAAHGVWNPPTGDGPRRRVIDAILRPDDHRSRHRVTMMMRSGLVASDCSGLCSHEDCQCGPTPLGLAVVEYLKRFSKET